MEARPSDRIKITGKDAAMLIKSGFLQRTDEFGTETLICTMKLHEILRAMGLCGYRSWAGVSRISFKETVPSGYKSKDWNDWGCTEIEASMVEVEEEGYRRVAHSRSEERSVGKEWVRTCRSRWSPYP